MLTKEELLAAVHDSVAKGLDEKGKEIVKSVIDTLRDKNLALAGVPDFKTVGAQFAENAAVKEFHSSQSKNTPPLRVDMKTYGYGLKAGERQDPRFAVNGVGIVTKAGEVITSLFPSERTYLPFAEFPQRRFRLRDLIPVAGLGTPQIEYARITGYSNLAAGVAELASKPQTQVVLDSVKLIATFMPVTRQAVADVPGLAGYVNQVLVYFMQLKEDNEVLSGGGGVDITGLLNIPGLQTRPLGADTRIDAVRKAITDLQIAFVDAGFQPNGIVMHPTDWQNFELQKDSTGKYLLIPFVETPAEGGPQPPRLWRLPVVPTPAITQGTALVGAFDIGATIWTYEDVTLRITDSHADFFVKNLLAILAEFRELLAVYFPRAFESVTGL